MQRKKSKKKERTTTASIFYINIFVEREQSAREKRERSQFENDEGDDKKNIYNSIYTIYTDELKLSKLYRQHAIIYSLRLSPRPREEKDRENKKAEE